MDKLEKLRIFVRVAEMGSFIRASHALDVPRATVSAAIAQLEAEMGTRLLHRTTRQVNISPDGTLLLERSRQVLADVDEIDNLFRSDAPDAVGRLNVDVPSRIARRLIAPALPDFFQRYPYVQLALGSTDRSIDLVQEGVDCAIRLGTLKDSSLVKQRLGRIALVNCASPAYLERFGTPRDPEDLSQHLMVGYCPTQPVCDDTWQYVVDGQVFDVPLKMQVSVNSAESYIACCLAGLGLIQVPRYDVQRLLGAGELVEVMAGFQAAPMDISALYPHRRHRSRRLHIFIEWFSTLIAPHLLDPTVH